MDAIWRLFLTARGSRSPNCGFQCCTYMSLGTPDRVLRNIDTGNNVAMLFPDPIPRMLQNLCQVSAADIHRGRG